MNEEKEHSLKELIVIITGVLVSLAGLIYIAKQYSRTLLNFLTVPENDSTRRVEDRIAVRFRQIDDTTAQWPAEEESDLSADIPD